MQDNINVRLMRENPYVRPLENARRVAGGEEQLAEVLRISKETLSRWLSGEVSPPMKSYMAAIHLVGRSSMRSRAA
jgi:transcriptional regulator with XRE-family HTH domain